MHLFHLISWLSQQHFLYHGEKSLFVGRFCGQTEFFPLEKAYHVKRLGLHALDFRATMLGLIFFNSVPVEYY